MSSADEAPTSSTSDTVERVCGANNRARLLMRYFAAHDAVTTETAWQHVYRLLLWIDRTTALAHCYVTSMPMLAWSRPAKISPTS